MKGVGNMLGWLSANVGTIVVLAVLILIVALIIIGMVRNKKNGKSSCGCNCQGCSMSGSCHGNQNSTLQS